ncbi:MAG: S-layer homology domain-containing protein [Lachnospiraceae bacterium]|nr:S-layer homology domain-containing protein [Lachnospiraceae bacterium]
MKRSVKSIVSVILSLIMIIGLIQVSSITAKADGNVADIFSDVQAGQWYVEAVQFVYDRGIMVGTNATTFGVSQKLQREQFAQILYSMAGKPAVAADAENPFKDVKNNPGYPRDAILWAYSEGIVAGNADGTFGVGQAIQRQAIAVMLYKFANESCFDLTAADNAIDGYDDKSSVANWAAPSMKWAVTQGIISGKAGNKLDPAGNGTRAECAQMIMKLVKKNSELPNVGEIIKFGKYEQDGNLENGKEDIEWQVTKTENDKNRVLVVSRFALDCKKYNETQTDVTWETCSLRKWLNDDFKNEAFSSCAQKRIPTVKILNENNPKYNTPGGNNTDDRIFCLSLKEMENLFGSYSWYDNEYMYGNNQNLICTPTQYAINNGAYYYDITEEDYNIFLKDKGYTEDVIGRRGCNWWLRSPGSLSNRACYVDNYGSAGATCHYYVNFDYLAVRPAMYIEY